MDITASKKATGKKHYLEHPLMVGTGKSCMTNLEDHYKYEFPAPPV